MILLLCPLRHNAAAAMIALIAEGLNAAAR
jgi:hypothetical protein